MINERYPDGTPKPPRLYEWQVKHQVHDEDPFYEMGACHFSLLAELPRHVAEMAKEREAAAMEHQQQMAELNAKLQSFRSLHQETIAKLDSYTQRWTDMMERQDRILSHVRQIESDFGVKVIDQLDYDKLARPLAKRVEDISSKIPLDKLQRQVEDLSHSGDRIEIACHRIDHVAESVQDCQDPKRQILLIAAGAISGVAVLLTVVYALASLPHSIAPGATQGTNAIVPVQQQ